jgi:hypothetical protein
MRVPLLILVVLFSSLRASTQALSPADKKLVDDARSHYYSLPLSGFSSMKCSVKFDLSTVPLVPSDNTDPKWKLVDATQFTLSIDIRGRPSVEHSYPISSAESERQAMSPITNLLTSLITGVFQTWPTKGLQGPVPPFDSQIQSILPMGDGYRLTLNVPGGPVEVTLNKDYLAREIVSAGGKIVERPEYSPSSGGFIFVGNSAVDTTQGSQVDVSYEIKSSDVNGLTVPSSVRLKVNQNIDVRFALDDCKVEKGVVLKVAPPPS